MSRSILNGGPTPGVTSSIHKVTEMVYTSVSKPGVKSCAGFADSPIHYHRGIPKHPKAPQHRAHKRSLPMKSLGKLRVLVARMSDCSWKDPPHGVFEVLPVANPVCGDAGEVEHPDEQ